MAAVVALVDDLMFLQAGCTTVLPRSAFVQKLDGLLGEAAAAPGGGGEPGAGA